jgi:glycosyltransferase involved in cell wall biosynthesis
MVPIRDADVIAERLIALHRDRELAARMGEAARATAERYPWRRYGDTSAAAIAALLTRDAAA